MSVSQSVCQSITWLCRAKTAEMIEACLGLRLLGTQFTLHLDGGPVPPLGERGSMRPLPNYVSLSYASLIV